MSRLTSTQRQEQKTIAEVDSPLVKSDAPRYVFITILIAILGIIVLWVTQDVVVRVAMVCTGVMLAILTCLWFWHWLRHELKMDKYELAIMEKKTHFFAYGEHIVGDETTLGYRHFHISGGGEVKQEYEQPKVFTQDTYEQIQDRGQYDDKQKGLSWEEVAGKWKTTVGIARGAVKRHKDRIERGETYE